MPMAMLMLKGQYHPDSLLLEGFSYIAVEMMWWVWHSLGFHQLLIIKVKRGLNQADYM